MNEEWSEQGQEETEINLVDLLLALKQKWWAMVTGLLIGLLLAGVYTWGIQKPTYQANSLIYMRGAGSTVASFQDLQIGAALTKDYEIIFTSRPVLEQVIERLNLDTTYQKLQKQIVLSNPSDTRILKVTMTGVDAEQISQIINTLVEVGIDSVKEIDAKEPYLVEKAIADWNPVGPSATKNLAVGGFLGLFLVAGFLILLYVWNDRIRSSEDVEKVLGAPVLCLIPESKSCNYARIQKKHR